MIILTTSTNDISPGLHPPRLIFHICLIISPANMSMAEIHAAVIVRERRSCELQTAVFYASSFMNSKTPSALSRCWWALWLINMFFGLEAVASGLVSVQRLSSHLRPVALTENNRIQTLELLLFGLSEPAAWLTASSATSSWLQGLGGGEEGESPINIWDLTRALGFHHPQKMKPADAISPNFQ